MTLESQPHPRRWLVLLAMTGSLSMIFVDITVTGVAGPAIARDFGAGPDGISWVANAYILALAALMAIGGRLGDLFGRRHAFVAGVAVFAAASAVCGMAGSLPILLAGRVLQGVGAALMQPASSSIVIDTFAPGERGKAMGVYIGIPMSFFALGPVLGGLLAEHVGWRSVFYLNLPIAALAMGLALWAKPTNHRSSDRSFDGLSALLLVLGLPAVVFALQDGVKTVEPGAASVAEPRTLRILTAPYLAALAGGLALCALFVWRQFRTPRPLLALRLFADRALLADAALIAIMQFAMAGIIVEGSIYAQEVLGYAPTRAGASLMPMLVPVIFLARRAGALYDRLGVRPLARAGTACAALGFCVWAAGCVAERYAVIAVGMALLGAGVAFIMSPANTDALSRAGSESRGQLSGLMQTFRQLGGALGVAFAACVVDAVRGSGQPLSVAIGAAMFGGAIVAALGAVVALRMPGGAPAARR